ncbi:cytoplasmic protein [Gallid alphaherpesvirus 2]|nr:cytoplasmic protein [Gallid alphaherpesvirus 2]AYC12236.1 cytoplasmic protein [Gallid alphaherpesvirus 2]UOW64073.1 cytoplasmic protein [Gallid alphaherpesvirus 2]UOW64095.1 cytoplasmic protein [Gallid alphaherpesvirus 2]
MSWPRGDSKKKIEGGETLLDNRVARPHHILPLPQIQNCIRERRKKKKGIYIPHTLIFWMCPRAMGTAITFEFLQPKAQPRVHRDSPT